jgi:2-polyprenyl-6-methoxyphenol hydroxylase-like FAD-dependent oxidoreductase
MSHVVVVGAGIGGLGAALALSRSGHRVTLIERDDTPMPDTVEAAFDWDRRGAPQVRHSHGFAARLHEILRTRFPDVLEQLTTAGAVEHDLGALLPEDLRHDMGELKVIAARRTTYEWVLRRVTLRSPMVALRVGAAVESLVVRPSAAGALPLVTGVRLADGTEILGDAVVASTGRRGEITRWLEPCGVEVPEVVAPTGITYLTRFYRLASGRSLDGGLLLASQQRAGVSYSCVGADNGTFSITVAVETTDAALRRHLLEPAHFEAVCQLLPGIDHMVDPAHATPLTEVHAMGGLINRLRRFLDPAGRPRVLGFHAVGDAHTTTNPLYGRGCSLAMVQAVLLSDAFAAHPTDRVAQAYAYEQVSASEVEPWYHFSVDGDAMRNLPEVDPDDPRFTLRDLMRAGVAEPQLLPKTLRVLSLLETPDAVAQDPVFARTLVRLRVEHTAKLASRRARGYAPSIQRADLLRAGVG